MIINAAIGVATAIATAAHGRRRSNLWGTVACLLNYAPIFGPIP